MIGSVVILCCLAGGFFGASLAVNIETRKKYIQAEQHLRHANERLYEADVIWQRIKKAEADATSRFVRNMRGDTGGKVLEFKPRHLKSVPVYTGDDDPKDAA